MAATIFTLSVLLCTVAARADDETCASCDHLVQASGQFEHYKYAADVQIQGTTSDNAAAFREEVNGDHFTISISRLPAGKFTVIIGEAETYFNQTGQRLFDVTCDGTTLAKNFDIVAAAGGPNKVCTISGQVDHVSNSTRGPMSSRLPRSKTAPNSIRC